jgi:hypothetical protein
LTAAAHVDASAAGNPGAAQQTERAAQLAFEELGGPALLPHAIASRRSEKAMGALRPRTRSVLSFILLVSVA